MRQQGGFFYSLKIIIILAIVGAGFFCGQKVWAAGSASIMISEVQVGGKTVDDEFIELYNPTGDDINLSSYSIQYRGSGSKTFSKRNFTTDLAIKSKGYFLIVSTQYSGGVAFDLKQGTFNLSGDGGTIFLVSNQITLTDDTATSPIVLDRIAYGKGSYLFPESIVYSTTLSSGKSLARKIINGIMQDTDNNAGDFEINSCPSPKAEVKVCQEENIEQPAAPPEPAPTNPPSPLSQGGETAPASTTPSQVSYKLGDVVINELVSDPADNEVEWIELLNKSGQEIDLTGWRIEEGSKAKTNLNGNIGASEDGRYKVIEKPLGNLNNSGDLIVLYDRSGKIIDQVAYGNWNDGNTADNAPAAGDPLSLARKFDGYNTFNNSNDFAATLKPTKGASNIIQAEDEVSPEAKAKFDFSNDIFISEILPNPAGDDTKLEFIEIYNGGAREVNLTGWSLSREDDKKVNLEKIATSTIIKAGEYLAFFRTRTKIVLHNDQGQVKLFQPLADKPFMSVDYKNVKDGWSYNLKNPLTPFLKGGSINGEWVWSETITPGAVNVFKTANHAPEVEFNLPAEVLIGAPVIFDSSDTADEDDDKLTYGWDFGDGFYNSLANPEHTYFKAGIYKVKLAVSDGKATSTKEKSLKVVNSLGEMVDVNVETPLTPLLKGGGQEVIINEIMPNPEGADAGQEWLELKNQSAEQIDLLNWRVENSNGKYKFKSEQFLEAGAFYVLDNAISKLAFKNTDDVISLYNDLDELADQVEYASAVQGEAYARGINGNWFWTTVVTAGEENIIKVAESGLSLEYQASGMKGSANEYVETDLEKVRELEIGSLVKVKGTVAVEPGVLGVQIFYIVGSPGIQIYNYKKDFPALKIGDYIEVTGELAQTQGEFRIKTKDKSDINLIEHKALPIALAVKADEVSEETIGQLIAITGEITDKKSTSLYVDDGNDEIFVYIKQSTSIDTKSLAAGQRVSVTGILSKTSTGLRLLPRRQEDIVLINLASGNELESQVLGEVATSDEWELAERDKKLELFKYLLIIAGGVIIVLAGLFIKLKRKV